MNSSNKGWKTCTNLPELNKLPIKRECITKIPVGIPISATNAFEIPFNPGKHLEVGRFEYAPTHGAQ